MFFHPAPPSRRCLAAVFLDVTPILLLDEVLAVGDFVFAEKCFAHFEECRKKKSNNHSCYA
jgi:ABC-type polysaccharide/polyol phosphate transport system ATPase subunit